MSNLANYAVLSFVLVSIAWGKVKRWRYERNERKQARLRLPDNAEKHGRFDDFSLRRPSDAGVLLAALTLVSWHALALSWPTLHLYRTDLFLLLGLQANAPIAYIRGRVAALPFDGIRWKVEWGEEALELLLRRLGSYEGRKLHLALGIQPFVACTFCTTADDYRLFAGLQRLGAYSIQLVLFGLLTMRHDALEVLDETIFSVVEFFTGRDLRPTKSKTQDEGGNDGQMDPERRFRIREDRKAWRRPLLYILGLFAAFEVAVFASLYPTSLDGSRWDHFHANSRLAWHSVLLIMAVLTFISPQRPSVHPIHELVHLLQQAKRHNDESLGQVQAMHLAQQILWGDAGLRRHVAQWHDERDEAFNERLSPDALNRLTQQIARTARMPNGTASGQAPDEAAFKALQEMARATSAQVWLHSARNWQRATANCADVAASASADTDSPKSAETPSTEGRESEDIVVVKSTSDEVRDVQDSAGFDEKAPASPAT